ARSHLVEALPERRQLAPDVLRPALSPGRGVGQTAQLRVGGCEAAVQRPPPPGEGRPHRGHRQQDEDRGEHREAAHLSSFRVSMIEHYRPRLTGSDLRERDQAGCSWPATSSPPWYTRTGA